MQCIVLHGDKLATCMQDGMLTASLASSAVLSKAPGKGSSAGHTFSALSVSLTFSGFSRKSSSAPTLAACHVQTALQKNCMRALHCVRTTCDEDPFLVLACLQSFAGLINLTMRLAC